MNDCTTDHAIIDQLADDIALCATRIDAATHQLLTHIRHFDEASGWAKQGAKSCAAWLSWRIGLGAVAAREKVRVARALGKLPLIDDALKKGELSYAKLRAITRVADAESEEMLLHFARGATGAALEKICARFRGIDKHDTERRSVRKRQRPDGTVAITVTLEPDEAERVWQALRERGDVLDVGRRRRTVTPPMWRALLTRQRHCCFPGCSHAVFVEAHHACPRGSGVEHWLAADGSAGGDTSVDNLLLLCHGHHVAVHEGGFAVDFDESGTPVFREPSGRVIEQLPAPLRLSGSALETIADEQRQRGVHVDAATSLPLWDGTPANISGAVEALAMRSMAGS